MMCGEFSLVNEDTHSSVATTLFCRAWNCDTCAPKRRAELITLAANGTPNRLLTITVNPQIGVSPADRAAKLARAWRLVVSRAKRQLKLQSIEYLAVFEATKRGEPHLHILCRCGFIPQRWLSAQLNNILRSPIVDIRRVHNASHAARYVAKYIGKAPHRFATCKRYWHTRSWVNGHLQRKDADGFPQGRWRVEASPLWSIAEEWQVRHYQVAWEGRDRITATWPHWLPHPSSFTGAAAPSH